MKGGEKGCMESELMIRERNRFAWTAIAMNIQTPPTLLQRLFQSSTEAKKKTPEPFNLGPQRDPIHVV
jgi:hypothetical protein